MSSPVTDDLLNLEHLNEWLSGRGDVPGKGAITHLEKLSGGSQNNIYLMMRLRMAA